MALPSKRERIEEIRGLLAEGIDEDDIIGKLSFGKEYESLDALQWDIDDAKESLGEERKLIEEELANIGNKEWNKERHIRERELLLERANKVGQLSVAVQCLQEIAKIQNLYKEAERKDNTIELVWTFSDNGSGDRRKKEVVDGKEDNGEFPGEGVLSEAILLHGEDKGEGDSA